MKKWLIIACSIIIALGAGTALADLTYTQGSGTTIFDFICFTTKHCSAHVLIDSSGTEKATSGNPLIANINAALPAGTNSIGTVTIGAPTLTIQGMTGGIPVPVSFSTPTVTVSSSDPCAGSAKSNVAISAGTATVQMVAGVSAKKVYMCSLSLISNAVVVVSVIEGTGSLCTTANEAAVVGSTVATAGMVFTTNGGLTLGNGAGTVGFTGTAANGLCLLQSLTTALVSGNLTYVQQ